jgi:hypothetical protein
MWKPIIYRGWIIPSVVLHLLASAAMAKPPYGLDSRDPIGPYLNNLVPPTADKFELPSTLSATGAFSDVRNLIPVSGVIPFTVNSPLWSDGAIKRRWIAVPNNGPPYTADEQIRFVPVGEWFFPNGTVFIKHFELTVNEITREKKRLETRLLVRDATGAVYGATYKWRPDNTDADLLPGGLDENILITTASGQTRIQTWRYPSRFDCLYCHNQPANYVLGVKTHQLNGDFTYPSTGRTDNQLRTFRHLRLLNPAPSDSEIGTYLKSVAVTNASVPIQYRMRSWIDANCSQCHRPGGFGPGYDARFYTPLSQQNLIGSFVKFRDLGGSELYQRDNSLGLIQMPPLAKNVVHQDAMAVLRQWIASPLEVLSVNLYQDTKHIVVRFNSHVEAATAAVASNYSLEPGANILKAEMGQEPDTVILITSALLENREYVLTTTGVEDTAPSANTIWPGSRTKFIAQFPVAIAASRLRNASGRVRIGAGGEVAIQGFIVRGAISKRVMIRAIGPALNSAGINEVLPDPLLQLYDRSGSLIATNNNWRDNPNQQEIIDTGLAPSSPNESVILMKLASDQTGLPYTAVLQGANGTTGNGLLEIYDLDRGLAPTLVNSSTRGSIRAAGDVLIGGFVIGDESSSTNMRMVIRAIGPSLISYGLTNVLTDSILALYDRDGDKIGANDNWKDTQESELQATGIAPRYDSESALGITLPPGNYTVLVRDKSGAGGIGLVETYVLD